MPYTIAKNEQGEFCVHKMDMDGKPMGKSMGCHKTRDEAMAQMRAIEANEKMLGEKRLMKLTQVEVNYTPVSIHAGEACAACRWYMMNMCHLIENMPLAIEPTGYCDRFEAAPAPQMIETTIEVTGDVTILGEPMGMTDSDEHKQHNGNERADTEPANSRSTPGGFWGAIKSILGVGSAEPQTSVFKVLDNRHWYAAYTNNFVDLEGEIIADKAHERYVARAQADIVPMPELWLKHIVGTKHGQAIWVWKDGHMVAAIGTFDDTPLAQAMVKHYQRAKSRDIDLSHGFEYPKWAKKNGVYQDYTTFEITTIPTQFGRGANPYITFEELGTMALAETDRKMLEQLLPADEFQRVLKLNEQHAERMKQLEAIGVAYKDFADVTPAPPAPQPNGSAVKALASNLLEGQEETLKALETLTGVFNGAMKALEAQKQALETRERALDERINQVQALIDAKPRRVDESNGNAVTDADAEKQLEATAGVEYDPQYPGMKIPLKKS